MNTEVSRAALLILVSYHHKSTADVLQEYGLIGFGSGIYDAKHHQSMLELANRLTPVADKQAFIFSTSAIITKSKVASDHSALRDILESKGYTIADEFSCRGFNTNSFLKYFGGMNKGRPNAQDLEDARAFALHLQQNARDS